MKLLTIFASLALLLTACNTVQQAVPQPSIEPPSALLGVLRVDLSGLGSSTPQVTGQFVRPDLNSETNLSSQTLNYVNPAGLSAASGWVVFQDDDLNNVRYLNTVLRLQNNSGITLNNLTLHALSLSSGSGFDTLGGTGIGNLKDAAGTVITNASTARAMQPTHGTGFDLGGAKLIQNLAHLQAYTVLEAAQAQTLYNTNVPAGAGKVLGYGFTATSSGDTGGRSIVTGSAAQVALAYRLPKTNPRAQNPWSLSLYFMVTTDSETSVTQSLEEQTDNTSVVTRAGVVSATKIRTLAESTLLESRTRLVCGGAYALNPVTSAPEKWLSDPAVYAGSGRPDVCTFGTKGQVVTPLGSSSDVGRAVALQSDGKIVVAGQSFNGSNNDFALARYTSSGALDTGFGTGGKVITPLGSSEDLGKALILQSDGKMVVAGSSYNGSNNDFALVRYLSSGVLDTTFGTGGKVTTPIGTGDDQGFSVALQSDGKLVVAGFSTNGANYDFALARYTSSGALDAGFGTGGKVLTDFGSGDFGSAVAVQSDGKIVVAGWSNTDFALARYTSSGALDTGFGTGGKVLTDLGSRGDQGKAMVLQSDGKIVVAGWSDSKFGLARYLSSGVLDTGFGLQGKVLTPFNLRAFGNAVALQSDGKIVVAGQSDNGTNYDFALVRYLSSGVLDRTFGTGGNGRVITPIGTDYDVANAVIVQSDGKIVVVGSSRPNGTFDDFAVVRYQP